ncbi:hypothetical protein CMT41_16700 [Colwellia sp. MT41]|uniref:hypothetical protein n=1 Tax=Colwellia sp. MT41 TaxID=58049 RepID=UPI0007177BAD|nr:hypothetical protein [Colwellia sp. MT41]ALO36186.1 hypothetical protein CMT41_16700 [Colwellia sp. MT41]
MNRRQKIKLKLFSFINKIRLSFQLEMTESFYRVVVHENAKPYIMLLKSLLTLVSLFLAFIVFEKSFYAFVAGLTVYLLITFLEQTIFIYNSFLVMPQLTYEHDPERLLGVSFGVGVNPSGGPEIPIVGFVVKDEEYAHQMHETLLYWAGGSTHDEAGNVCLSTIVLNPKEYVFLCYPNLESDSVKKHNEGIEKRRKAESLTDVHVPMFALTIIGKRCEIGPQSYFPLFREKHKDGVPVLFQICIPGENGGVKSIDGLDDFVLFNLKIRDKDELTRMDIEYDYMRVMG